MFRESKVLTSIRDRLARRGLLIGTAASGVAVLAAGVRGAAQPTPGPGGIEWLDYTPPRRYAAGARFGNVVYLSGETGQDLTTGKTIEGGIGPQTQLAFENIRHNLRLLGSDLQYVFRITTYLVNILDIEDLYVAPAHQMAGVGGRLIDSVVAWTRRENIRYLLAYSSTRDVDRVLRFYRSCGFESWSIQMFRDLEASS